MSQMTELEMVAIRALQIFEARHPRPPHVTQTQAAEMLRVSRPTVRKYIASRKLRLNKCGLIPVEQIDHLLLAESP